jgi:hypothetical protein
MVSFLLETTTTSPGTTQSVVTQRLESFSNRDDDTYMCRDVIAFGRRFVHAL